MIIEVYHAIGSPTTIDRVEEVRISPGLYKSALKEIPQYYSSINDGDALFSSDLMKLIKRLRDFEKEEFPVPWASTGPPIEGKKESVWDETIDFQVVDVKIAGKWRMFSQGPTVVIYVMNDNGKTLKQIRNDSKVIGIYRAFDIWRTPASN